MRPVPVTLRTRKRLSRAQLPDQRNPRFSTCRREGHDGRIPGCSGDPTGPDSPRPEHSRDAPSIPMGRASELIIRDPIPSGSRSGSPAGAPQYGRHPARRDARPPRRHGLERDRRGPHPPSACRAVGAGPEPGDEGRFALGRHDQSPEGTRPITMSSPSPTKTGCHRPEDRGPLRFEGSRSSPAAIRPRTPIMTGSDRSFFRFAIEIRVGAHPARRRPESNGYKVC
jgi:hypothetical protein